MPKARKVKVAKVALLTTEEVTLRVCMCMWWGVEEKQVGAGYA
jgi:hypothetical protein